MKREYIIEWLTKKNAVFDNISPIELIWRDGKKGLQEVEIIVLSIELGSFS